MIKTRVKVSTDKISRDIFIRNIVMKMIFYKLND
jgi:hypothetical protein